MSDLHHTETTVVGLDEAGYVVVEFTGADSTAASADKTLRVIEHVAAGTPKPVLFDARSFGTPDPESWITFTQGISEVASAAAVIIGEELRGRFGGFMRAINTMLIPFEAFDDEQEARAFLMQFVD